MGRWCISLHRGCMGEKSSGRVVGVSAWCIAHVWHTQVNTSVGTVYYFLVLKYIKKPIYLYCFVKYICSMKRTLVVSDLVLARRGSENVFDRPWVLKCDTKTTDIVVEFLYKYYNPYVVIFGFKLWDFNQTPHHLDYVFYVI